MENNVIADLRQERQQLIKEWNSLSTMPAATQRDYIRLKAKIEAVQSILDSLQMAVK